MMAYSRSIYILITYLFSVIVCAMYIMIYRSINLRNGVISSEIYRGNLKTDKTDNNTTTCTIQLLRELAEEYQEFPYKGEWDIRQKGVIKHWISDMCNLNIRDDISQQSRELLHFITHNHVSRITLLGDSNGAKYNTAMIKYLKGILNATCTTEKKEKTKNMNPDIRYFLQNSNLSDKHVIIHERDCFSCKSALTECQVNDLAGNLTVEYIAMEYVLDNEVTTFRSRTFCKNNNLKPCDYSITYQEFIFREYLSGNYPDILLIFMNNHDRSRKSIQKISSDTAYFSDILGTYLPARTMTIWFSAMSEYKAKKPLEYQNESEEIIMEVNKAVFQGLQPRLGDGASNQFCFFDLGKMSHPVRQWWNYDGIHMKPDWYKKIISYLFTILYTS